MGFPNVDLILRDLFLAEFAKAKSDPTAVVADLFEDRTAGQQSEIEQFLNSRIFTGDIRNRDTDKRVFILPHFPAADLPFPQIGIYSGDVESNDRSLGDYQGEPEATEINGQTVWSQLFGYWEMSAWNIDVIAATKEETIWLARFCQYFVCQNFTELGAQGIVEIGISMADLRMEKGSLQPTQAFIRGIKIHAKVANTWSKRLEGSGTYATGDNLSLTGA
jgi:hypothetical protein